MQILKGITILPGLKSRGFTRRTMQADFEYEIASILSMRMFCQGLLDLDETITLLVLNLEAFEPIYKELMH